MPKAFSFIREIEVYKRRKCVFRIYKLSEILKYCEVTFRCIHGGKNFKSRVSPDRSERIYLSM